MPKDQPSYNFDDPHTENKANTDNKLAKLVAVKTRQLAW